MTISDGLVRRNLLERSDDGRSSADPATPVVALCSDDNYVSGVIGTLAGVRRFAGRPIEVHILSDGITPTNKNLIQDSVGPVEFHDISTLALPQTHESTHLSRTSWGRIFIAQLVPRPRCLYLDCDLLVRSDVGALWDLPIHSLFGAAIDLYLETAEIRGGVFSDFPERPYWNSGLLLINLERAREIDLPERIFEVLSRVPSDKLYMADQDALNYAFHEQFTTLPQEWNVLVSHAFLYPEAKVIHFCGADKPWMPVPWQKTTEERSQYLALVAKTGVEPFVSLRRNDRLASPLRRGVRQLLELRSWLRRHIRRLSQRDSEYR